MTDAASIETALRAQLPTNLYSCIPALATVIVDLQAKTLTPNEARNQLQAEMYASLREALAVKAAQLEVSLGGDTITIGAINQARGVAIGHGATVQVIEGGHNTVAQAASGGIAVNIIISAPPTTSLPPWVPSWLRSRRLPLVSAAISLTLWLAWTVGFIPLTYVIARGLVYFSPPPQPMLPPEPVIAYHPSPSCEPQLDVIAALQSVTGTVSGTKVLPATHISTPPQATVSFICQNDHRLRTVTIDFSEQPPIRIPLLQEPRRVVLHTNEIEAARKMMQIAILYALGEYEDASILLNQHSDSSQSVEADSDGAWLTANIRFHLEDWHGAIIAYTQAMEGRDTTDPALPQLLANRALTRFYARQATGEALAAEECRDFGRPDSKAAVESKAALTRATRFELQIIYSLIFLHCIAMTDDGEKTAPQAAATAIKMAEQGTANEQALAYDLMAMVRAQNRALPIGSDPRQIQEDACQAIRLDPSLATPYKTLALMYARYQLWDAAHKRFRDAEQRAPMRWQRQEMIRLRLQLWKWQDVVWGGLPAVSNRRPLGSCPES